MADEISEKIHSRENAPQSTKELFSRFFNERAPQGLQVSMAWRSVNGDIERAHTTGTFVKKDPRCAAPILLVYVDSTARVIDFSANSEVYLARLAHAGYQFSKIEFHKSKWTPRQQSGNINQASNTASSSKKDLQSNSHTAQQKSLPEDTLKEIDSLVLALPSGLRASVSQAMRASYQREQDNKSL